MTQDSSNSAPSAAADKADKPKTSKQSREDKLAQALRDNLRRRKQAASENKKSAK